MCERAEPFAAGAFRNNNQQEGLLADGDANANDIHAGVRGDTSTHSAAINETGEQDKIIIWGTDSQCDDPELAEFEMLECQELEAYLVEDENDFVGLAERKDLLEQSCSKVTADPVQDYKSCEKDTSVSLVSESKEASRAELNSETDIYVSCLSTISSLTTAVDPVGRSQMTDSWQMTTGSYSTASEDLTLPSKTCKADRSHLAPSQSSKAQKEVDINLNLTPDVVLQEQVNTGVLSSKTVADEHSRNNNQRNEPGRGFSERLADRGRSQHKDLSRSKLSVEESSTKMDKGTQADALPEVNNTPVLTGTKESQPLTQHRAIKKQGSFDNTLKKQNSFDRSFKKQPSFENSFKKQLSFDNSLKKQDPSQKPVNSNSSSLERRKPWGSPSRSASSVSSKTASSSPKRRPPASPAKVQGVRALSLERSSSPQTGLSHAGKPPGKMLSSSGIPKPVMLPHKELEPSRSSSPQRPKNVRPKIITYVRANQAKPQVTDVPREAMTRSSSHSSPPAQKDSKVVPKPKSTPVLCSSNLLFDKYRQEMLKTGHCPPGTTPVSKPPSGNISQRLPAKSGSFHEDGPEKYYKEQPSSQEGGNVYCSPRTLRPQLGLGAVNRQPAAKTRIQMGQRPNQAPNHSSQAAAVTNHAGEQKRSGPENTPKSILLKPGQSGLRPPGFSALPLSRLSTFGFTRSSSVSPVPSNQFVDSSNSDLCRPAQHPSSGIDEAASHNTTSAEPSRCQSWNQPPNAPSLQRRSVAPQRSSPVAVRRETPKDNDSQPKSSPKRFAVVSPKPQSPVRGRTGPVHVPVQVTKVQDLDKAVIQQLRDRCEQQAVQLQSLQVQMKEAALCLDVFSVTTQHFWKKNENAVVKERELYLELAKIRDEVAFSTAHWKQLQREKEELERHFELELQGLRARQKRELGALEERLKEQHMAEMETLQDQQQAEMEELQIQQQEQIDEINENHEASLMELESVHSDTLSTLKEEHARTVKNLKMAHEQQRRSLELEFEKIRLSLQDQVDTLTFQNRSLQDRAKRFEEALRKSTDEQIVDALAPYKHIEEDLKSLKEVLEMKNQQIHQQELKITELEKIAEKNVHLEERLQVLQQQNEDLKERIDKNIAVSRQLTEENANLQVHVEMESKEKKRLSRTNEELMWRLQTGELSPHMSPTSSPLHRPMSGPGSPSRPHSYHQ